MLVEINNRLPQLMSKPENTFGGLALAAMEDFFQLPPVRAKKLICIYTETVSRLKKIVKRRRL